jgi:hypothetical protein
VRAHEAREEVHGRARARARRAPLVEVDVDAQSRVSGERGEQRVYL